jgi:hypothetical protein
MAETTFVHELTCKDCSAVVRFENEPPPWRRYPPVTISTVRYSPFEFIECPSCKGRIERRIPGSPTLGWWADA